MSVNRFGPQPAKKRDTSREAAAIARELHLLVALAVIVIVAGIGGVVFLKGLTTDPEVVERPVRRPPLVRPKRWAAPEHIPFTDVTAAAGIDFVHTNGARGRKLLPETMGGGCAFLDYDNDGDQDLLLVNSKYWPGGIPAGATRPTMALYRNDGTGSFENVTAASGLGITAYGMGVAVGDYDNDGHVDVFISALGPNHLFRNEGGTFREVTVPAGVRGDTQQWSTSSAFFDYDNDGHLDLFVGNYLHWSKEIEARIDYHITGIGRAYAPPMTFKGSHPYLYRNNGNGTFTDVSKKANIRVSDPITGAPIAKTLGVAPVDVDLDGWIDLLVTNDKTPNLFFHNERDGSFAERGVPLGLAFDRQGTATGATGVDAAFFRNAQLGIAIGNFAQEMTSFYVPQVGRRRYADLAVGAGVGPMGRLPVTFGLFFFDYDLDGRLDLFQVNGHRETAIRRIHKKQRYTQSPQLFWNAGEDAPRSYIDVLPEDAGDLSKPVAGRGASFADIDGDGDLDILITQNGRRPILLRNDQQLNRHWLRVKLIGRNTNRDAIGAQIELVRNGVVQRRRVMPTRSYLSQVELPVTFGLGGGPQIDVLRVRWPDGGTQIIRQVTPDSLVVVEQEL